MTPDEPSPWRVHRFPVPAEGNADGFDVGGAPNCPSCLQQMRPHPTFPT